MSDAVPTLEDVQALHLCFKPGPIRNAMLDIAQQMLDDRIKWGDEFELTPGPADRNCIGTAFRLLIHAGIISRMDEHRKSQRESQKSRTAWKYQLVSEPFARLFISRNGRTPHTKGQPEFSL